MERMNWLSRLASRGPGHRVPQGASLQTPVMADPETCLMVFKNHWSQVGDYMPKSLLASFLYSLRVPFSYLIILDSLYLLSYVPRWCESWSGKALA